MKRIILVLTIALLIPFSVQAATYKLTMTDEHINSLAERYNYQETIDGEPNPTSKEGFAMNIVESFVKQVHEATVLKELESTRQILIDRSKTENISVKVEKLTITVE